jgi:hypothetical protein
MSLVLKIALLLSFKIYCYSIVILPLVMSSFMEVLKHSRIYMSLQTFLTATLRFSRSLGSLWIQAQSKVIGLTSVVSRNIATLD